MGGKQAIKVALFGHYLPVYRKGVLEKLSSFADIELTAYYTEDYPAGLKLMKPDEVSFSLKNISTFRFKIPFIGKPISVQPAMLARILASSHDVYILPNTMSYLDVWISLILARVLGRRVCLWGHGKGSITGHVANSCRKVFMNMADALIFYTESFMEAWARSLPKKKLFVAYNALDTDASAKVRSTISDRDIEEFLRGRGLLGKKLIVFVGRLYQRKQPELAVQAMAHIVRDVPDAHLVVIGEGTMREAIEACIRETGLEQHVTLTGAIFDERTIAHYLMAAKIAVMPAQAGLYIQQAFDYGLPIVVGDDMRIHPPEIELVRDGKTGLFCKDGSAASLAEKATYLLLNEDIRKEMSLKAKQVIEEKYNKENMALGLAEAIRYAFGKN